MARCGIKNLKKWEICKDFQLVYVAGIYIEALLLGVRLKFIYPSVAVKLSEKFAFSK